ncbi:MAG TPA: ligase-associated DNA damage response endonuclease PdeM [Casimicrobiaceae bacterium]|nr:ligase-associated DNA damage response endonuclease PdeM [Casimicrobiaceae bacterium]
MSAGSLPLPLERHAAAARGAPRWTTSVGGERVVLHAMRALEWPRERTLFVADVHLGKAAAFRAAGVPLPRGSTAGDLGRLDALIAQANAGRVVVLGDFLHAKAGRVAALTRAFVAWRAQHASVDVVLVRGNHDARAGDPPPEWQVRCVNPPYPLPPFLACHHDEKPRTGYALCGHLHPAVRVASGRDAARLPCFVLGRERAILPAFGRFTGMADVAPARGERIVAIAGDALFELPPLSQNCNDDLPFVGPRGAPPRC